MEQPCGTCSAICVSAALAFEAEGARRQHNEHRAEILRREAERAPWEGDCSLGAPVPEPAVVRLAPGDNRECPTQPEARPARGPTPRAVAKTPDHSLFSGS